MGLIKFAPDLTIKYILSKVSEEEIFEKYGTKVQAGMFRSTLRKDRHPTCRFYRNKNNRLILHDFSGNFNGDCFEMVMLKLRCNFPDALYDIACKFGIMSGEPRHPAASSIIIGPKTLCEIRIKSGNWDRQHYQYWLDYGIKMPTLSKFDVVPVERCWLNGYIFYNRDFTKKNEVVFAYRFGGLDYKVYFPNRDRTKVRFLHNNPDILQGYDQLPDTGEVVVITKAMKDVMCLNEFGIPAIAPMGETTVVSDGVLMDLFERFDKVYALYDRDRTGKIALLNLRARKVKPLLMPKGTTKDFSDMCKLDFAKATELVNDLRLKL